MSNVFFLLSRESINVDNLYVSKLVLTSYTCAKKEVSGIKSEISNVQIDMRDRWYVMRLIDIRKLSADCCAF